MAGGGETVEGQPGTNVEKAHCTSPMIVVGLTGGIASGKSSVSTLLASYRIPVIDADVIARDVVAFGTKGLREIVSEFGTDILLPDGSLDRPKLGAIIFTDEGRRRRLNAITHPRVRRAMLWQVFRCWVKGEKICILDVPLLVEAGLWRFMGNTVVVYCSRDIQLQRLMKRDGSNREAALARLNAQLPLSDKLAYADQVIDNSGSPQDLQNHVDTVVKSLIKRAGWTWRIFWLIPPLGLLAGAWSLLWRNLTLPKGARKRRRTG